MSGEARLDDRQEVLIRIDTLESRPPSWVTASPQKKRSAWERFWLRLKAIILRTGGRA